MRDLAKMGGIGIKIVMLILCSGLIGLSEAGRDIREEMSEAAGYGMEKLSTVLVTGAVVCDACLAGNIATQPQPISGAVVGVACRSRDGRKLIRARGVADSYGDFIIDVPSDLHANPYLCRSSNGISHGDPPSIYLVCIVNGNSSLHDFYSLLLEFT